MECATVTSNAEKDTLLHEAVVLMTKATGLSEPATQCQHRLDDALASLAHQREQLAATSDEIANVVCRGLAKAWGTLQSPPIFATLIRYHILSRRVPKRTRNPTCRCALEHSTERLLRAAEPG